jgi:hypothetical protein
MKKRLLIALLLSVSVVMLFSSSIEVKSPRKGDVWKRGKTYKIKWQKYGNTGVNVKINIFKDSIKQTNFKLQLKGPNTGLMQWKIPANFATGTYILRMKGTDAASNDIGVTGDSSQFKIIESSGTPTITVTFPTSGLTYKTGDYLTINFTPKRINKAIDIFIVSKKTNKKTIICKNRQVNNNTNNQIQFHITNEIIKGEYFVKLVMGNLFWKSALFKIEKRQFSKQNSNSILNSNTFANSLSVSGITVFQNLPDIFIEKISSIPSGKVLLGRPFTVFVQIKNVGADIPFGKNIELVRNNNYSEYPKGGLIKFSGGLKRGHIHVFKYDYKGYGGIDDLFVLDPKNKIKESDEKFKHSIRFGLKEDKVNRSYDVEIYDLIVTKVKNPYSKIYKEGDVVIISATTICQDIMSKSRKYVDVMVGFFLNNKLIAMKLKERIATDQGSVSVSIETKLPKTGKKTLVIKAVADINNKIKEINENNNSKTIRIKIQ